MNAGAFEGRSDWIDALREGLLQACAQGSREIVCIDESFALWPWSDRAVLEALTQWAGRGRRLQLMALQYEDVMRVHPRFVRWRRDFDHCVESRCYEPEAMSTTGGQDLLTSALFVAEPPLALRLFDTRLWRGSVSFVAADALRTREWFDALAQRSSPCFAPTSLGL